MKKQVLSKEDKIKKEKQKLNKLFKNIDEKKLSTVSSLIENVAFMSVSLDELQQAINLKGYVEEYQNGANQKGVKKCSEVEIYNVMIKNYMASVKQLTELLPKEDPVIDDGFESFVMSRYN